MKRRSTLSLDPIASNDTKRVPGFDPAETASNKGAATRPQPEAATGWSTAASGKPRVTAARNVAAPKWGSATVVKALLLVVTGAFGLYLLRKRLVS